MSNPPIRNPANPKSGQASCKGEGCLDPGQSHPLALSRAALAMIRVILGPIGDIQHHPGSRRLALSPSLDREARGEVVKKADLKAYLSDTTTWVDAAARKRQQEERAHAYLRRLPEASR